tara:strand:- start:1502 stop:2917 length:1416 start_codon:yes stop_codon:yes gene_type:complete
MIPIPLAVNSYKARSGLSSSERLVNMYAEPILQKGPFQNVIYGTPGLVPWLDLANSNPIYGIEEMGNDIFVVCGLTVYKIDSNKITETIGTLPTAPNRVMMTNNGAQVSILTESGQLFYCTTVADSLTEVTDGDYVKSGSITTMDGFTIVTNLESTQFQFSQLNATENYSALDFANVLSDSSDLVRVMSNNLEVWFFKKHATLVYYHSDNADFIFERKNGVLIQKGCAAKHSVATIDNRFIFLGEDNIVYQTNGYQLMPISTAPISKEIESYNKIDDAYAYIYTQEAHKFYVLTFPTANRTWVYDISVGLWHERESLDFNKQPKEWRASHYINFAGKNLVGDNQSGVLYELDLDTYTENGTPIISKIITATLFDNYNRTSVAKLALVMDTGVGIQNGQGKEPEIMMRTSPDGGKVWSPEMRQPLGAQGEYEKEVFWTRIGYGRSLIVELSISDPVKRAIIQAYLEPTTGRS